MIGKSWGFWAERLVQIRTAMNPWREEMKGRTHGFAVDVINFLKVLPDRSETRRIKDQLLGAACGAGANWRAACRARSHREFAAKLGTVLEEADEAEGWLDILYDTKLTEAEELSRLRKEACRTANDNEIGKWGTKSLR